METKRQAAAVTDQPMKRKGTMAAAAAAVTNRRGVC